MIVPPDKVEIELARLWDEQVSLGHSVHARLINYIVVCATPDAYPGARGVVARLMPSHPGRALYVVLYPGNESSLTTSIELVTDTARHNLPVGEAVTVDVRGDARSWVPTTVERLLSPSARSYLWWVGDLPDEDRLFDKLTETSDAVAFHSGEMDLRDLRTLARITDYSRGSYAVLDMNWSRLRAWQDLLARFFDDPAVLPALARARRLHMASSPHRTGDRPEPTATRAMLYASWLLTRLGYGGEQVTWQRENANVVRVQVSAPSLPPFEVVFEVRDRSDVPEGSLLHARLESSEGEVFEVQRMEEDPRVLGWSGHCGEAVIPPAVLRSAHVDEAVLLGRLLDGPVRDRLFEQSLRTAARLLTPVYDKGGMPRV